MNAEFCSRSKTQFIMMMPAPAISRIIAIVALLTLTAPAYPAHTLQAMTEITEKNPVEINIDRDNNIIRLYARSNGCTRSTDFDFGLNSDGKITARRVRTDLCRRKAFAITFVYDMTKICSAIKGVADESRVVVEGERSHTQ